MELIYRAYENHLRENEPLHKPVSVKNQTRPPRIQVKRILWNWKDLQRTELK